MYIVFHTRPQSIIDVCFSLYQYYISILFAIYGKNYDAIEKSQGLVKTGLNEKNETNK